MKKGFGGGLVWVLCFFFHLNGALVFAGNWEIERFCGPYLMDKEGLKLELASLLHDEWRAPRWREEEGRYEPRLKVVDGVEFDIANLKYEDLPPKFQYENQQTGEVVMELIFAQREMNRPLDERFVEEASAIVHDKWLERNGSWASEEQKLPFEKLSKEEADKDRVMVQKGIWLYLKSKSP